MYFVYLLRSQKDGGYYIGQTDSIDRRLHQHLDGKVNSTGSRLPVELLYYEAYSSRTQAIQRELQLKQFGSAYVGLLKRIDLR
ncbi:MAG: GIY-YIG nuclease family protein [Patescibacteria group bacterium]